MSIIWLSIDTFSYTVMLNRKKMLQYSIQMFAVRCRIMKGIVDLNYTHCFKLDTTKTRGHKLKLYKQTNRMNVRQNFFSQRIIESWGKLPEKHYKQINSIKF